MSKLIRALLISAVATAVAVGMASVLSARKLRRPERNETSLPGEVDLDDLDPDQAGALMKELNAHL